MNVRLLDALGILVRSGPGISGLICLAILIVISAYVIATYPLDFGTSKWSNPAAWADYPKAVPPAWVSAIPGTSHFEHQVMTISSPTDHVGNEYGYRFKVIQQGDQFPTFVSVSLSNLRFRTRPPLITLMLERPDGTKWVIYRHVPRGKRLDEPSPTIRYKDEPMRVRLDGDTSVLDNLAQYHALLSDTSVTAAQLSELGLGTAAMFGSFSPSEQKFTPLSGRYEFILQVQGNNSQDKLGEVTLVLGGSSFGLMGTDALGRDLAVGLLFGFPVALFIGLMASSLTTAVGTTLGILSGYLGGWVDMVIQRLSDIVANIPLLPILIFMVFVFGSNLLLIILLLVVFSWPGLTILVRSMVLQLRTGQFIEASRALGASPRRIMIRHIFPQTAPFVLAQMIFFTPAAILAEAGLSFLGLGDPSIPTWGQILEQGFRTGAVYVGYWWWILPPGLLIVATAVTFALLALGLEPVINPRLRRTQ